VDSFKKIDRRPVAVEALSATTVRGGLKYVLTEPRYTRKGRTVTQIFAK